MTPTIGTPGDDVDRSRCFPLAPALTPPLVAPPPADAGREQTRKKAKNALRDAVRKFLAAWDDERDDPAGVNFAIQKMRAALSPVEEPTDAR